MSDAVTCEAERFVMVRWSISAVSFHFPGHLAGRRAVLIRRIHPVCTPVDCSRSAVSDTSFFSMWCGKAAGRST